MQEPNSQSFQLKERLVQLEIVKSPFVTISLGQSILSAKVGQLLFTSLNLHPEFFSQTKILVRLFLRSAKKLCQKLNQRLT
jgi:hypothetical protein